MNKTFGQMIAAARKAALISQKDLAAAIRKEDGVAISPQYLNDIEHDRRNPPSEFIITQIARELKLSADHLIAAAGIMPSDVQKDLTSGDPDRVDQAFRAFRRELKK